MTDVPMPPLPEPSKDPIYGYTAIDVMKIVAALNSYWRAYAEQETAALRADAERYRWLRENALTVDMVADPNNFVQVWTGTDPALCFRGRTLDAAIDAAIRSTQEQHRG